MPPPPTFKMRVSRLSRNYRVSVSLASARCSLSQAHATRHFSPASRLPSLEAKILIFVIICFSWVCFRDISGHLRFFLRLLMISRDIWFFISALSLFRYAYCFSTPSIIINKLVGAFHERFSIIILCCRYGTEEIMPPMFRRYDDDYFRRQVSFSPWRSIYDGFVNTLITQCSCFSQKYAGRDDMITPMSFAHKLSSMSPRCIWWYLSAVRMRYIH